MKINENRFRKSKYIETIVIHNSYKSETPLSKTFRDKEANRIEIIIPRGYEECEGKQHDKRKRVPPRERSPSLWNQTFYQTTEGVEKAKWIKKIWQLERDRESPK